MKIIIVLLLLLTLLVCICAAGPTARSITFNNQCSGDYYFSATSGSAPFNPSTLKECNSDSDCIEGSACLLPGTKICFWTIPTPATGIHRIVAGQSNSITFPYYENGNGVHWSGNFGFCSVDSPCTRNSTLCDIEGCSVSGGPSNIAEITMSKQGVDFYDVSNIGGVNVAMSFAPFVTNNSVYEANNPYWCGNPGSSAPTTQIGNSTWNASIPSFHYQWVVPSTTTCTQVSDCSNGETCGLTNVPGRNPQFQLNCGKLQGIWSYGGICGEDQNLLDLGPFQCNKTIYNGPYNTTLGAMQGCGGTSGSGYSNGADQYVCGCEDWSKLFGGNVVPYQTQNCTNSNPTWITNILPTIEWLKRLCPSCYTFPYDDMSSTFVCDYLVGGYNVINYTITLCPQNAGISTSSSTTTSFSTSASSNVAASTTSVPLNGDTTTSSEASLAIISFFGFIVAAFAALL